MPNHDDNAINDQVRQDDEDWWHWHQLEEEESQRKKDSDLAYETSRLVKMQTDPAGFRKEMLEKEKFDAKVSSYLLPTLCIFLCAWPILTFLDFIGVIWMFNNYPLFSVACILLVLFTYYFKQKNKSK